MTVLARYVRHPAYLAALGTLLANDLWLKGRAPGWLTGKLSDVAGLVVVVPLLALPFLLLRHRRAGLAACVLAGGWFAALKLSPAVAELTLAPVRAAVGSAGIVPDRTDLLALGVLPFAWWLWKRCAAGVPGRESRFASALAILAAVCATTATSYVPPDAVEHVAINDGVLYAGDTEGFLFARSDDRGVTWRDASAEWSRLAAWFGSGDRAVVRVSHVCFSPPSRTCYAVTYEEELARSADGGETWSPVGDPPEPALDVALVPGTPERVVVAAGEAGVLLVEEDGPLRRVPVLEAGGDEEGADSTVPFPSGGVILGALAVLLLLVVVVVLLAVSSTGPPPDPANPWSPYPVRGRYRRR